jgi:hypothetical protein
MLIRQLSNPREFDSPRSARSLNETSSQPEIRRWRVQEETRILADLSGSIQAAADPDYLRVGDNPSGSLRNGRQVA